MTDASPSVPARPPAPSAPALTLVAPHHCTRHRDRSLQPLALPFAFPSLVDVLEYVVSKPDSLLSALRLAFVATVPFDFAVCFFVAVLIPPGPVAGCLLLVIWHLFPSIFSIVSLLPMTGGRVVAYCCGIFVNLSCLSFPFCLYKIYR